MKNNKSKASNKSEENRAGKEKDPLDSLIQDLKLHNKAIEKFKKAMKKPSNDQTD